MYRPHDPLVIGAKLWPAYGFNAAGTQRETLATFFCRSDAEDFAMHPEQHGFEKRNVYVGAAREDRRGQ
jgi:hypothetical protein